MFFGAVLVPVAAFGQSAPNITQQPQNQTVVAGTNVSFTVTATGQTPFTYQWKFNGANLTNNFQTGGATGATLSLTNVTANNAGNYQVIVYDRQADPATSAVAALTVVFPPAITNQPVSLIQIAGSNALFSAGVTGTQPMGFRWFYNGQVLADNGRITGSTGLVLAITSLTTNDNGNYTFVATNAFGSVTSVVATLTVVIPPAISLQPVDQTGTLGFSASFTGAATSTAPISYQWLHDGVPLANDARISGATSGTLNLTGLTNSDAGGYQLVASNYLGVATSLMATLTVVPPVCAPATNGLVGWWPAEGSAIDIAGNNNGTLSGSGATYAAGKVGQGFRFDGTNGFVQIPDSAALKPANITVEAWVWLDPAVTNNGNEQIVFKKNTSFAWFEGYSLIKATIDNGNGTYSNRFQFCVSRSGNQVSINSQTIVQRGVWYHVAATYDGNQSKLYVNGVVEASATPGFALDYDTTPIYIGTSGTWAPYLSMFGGIIDEPSIYNRALAANEIVAIYQAGSQGKCVPPTAPFITAQPVNQAVLTNGTAIFNAAAGGTQPLSYQWYFNNAPLADNGRISGSTTTNLIITNVQTNDAGSYVLMVTNFVGSTNSSPATLAVLVPPSFSEQPQSQSVNAGTNLFLSATATGTQPISYRWWFNGTPLADGGGIAGSATSALAISNIQSANGGAYSVVATNIAGVSTSAVATVTVLLPPIFTTQPQGQSVLQGGSITFTSTVTSSLPVSYQWYFNGTNLFGATNASLTLSNVQPIQAGTYWVQAANAAGATASSNAVLLVTSIVPVITGLNPAIATPGAIVSILGTNFSATALSNTVYFGAVRAAVLSANVTNLMVAVPAGATFGPVTETVGGLTAYSAQLFEPTFTGTGSNITTSSFAPSFNLPAPNGPQSAVIADLDGDGKPDIAFVNGYSRLVSIYRNISTNGALLDAASFASRVDLVPPTGGTVGDIYRLRAVDLDGDGRLDLIATEVNGNRVDVFRNIATPGTLTTNSFETPFALITGNDCRNLAAADLDADGRVDIVALNLGDNTISILKNLGTGAGLATNSFAPPVVLAAPGGPYEVAIADLDGDGKPDLAVANTANNTVSIFQNFATAGSLNPNSFGARRDLPCGTDPETIATADLDGDGKLDLAVGCGQSVNVNIYRNLSSGGLLTTNSFASQVDFGTPGRMHTVSVADFNGDGKPDLGVVGELSSFMAVFQNTSTPGSFTVNSFAPRVDFSSGWNAWGIAAGDLNGDGRPDIVFGNLYDGNIQIYQNVMSFGTPSVCTPVPSGLVGWWQGEGNTGDMTGTNNGTLSGSGATFATGKVGQGFRFDGTNGFVQIPDSAALKPANVTVEAWVWLDPAVTNNGGEQIVFKKNTSTAWFEGYSLLKFTIDNGNGTYSNRFQFCVSRSGNQIPINSQTLVQRGVWYHVAATYDGNQSKIYVNGVMEASATPGFALDYGTDPVYIGTSGTWPPYLSMFAGIIDEPSIYNRALSTNEIAAIYNAGSAGKCSGPPPPTPPFISMQPASQTLLTNTTATFTVSAGGTQPLGYLWYFNNAPLTDNGHVSGSAATNLFVFNSQAVDVGNYFVVVTNVFGSVTSSVASLLVVSNLPSIVSQPQNQSVLAGSNAVFSAIAGGDAPLSYQWYFNGVALTDSAHIIGSASNNLTVVNAQSGDAGNYFLIVTNPAGMATSSMVSLTVLIPPVVTTQPVGRSVPPGLPTTFTGTASGSPTPGYQWQLNGTNLPGATSASYTIAAVGTNDLGYYQIVASNDVGSVTSVVAQLTFGPVAAWGRNVSLESLPPPNLSNVVSVAGMYQASFAVLTDGTVAHWGSSTGTNVPASATKVVAVAASGNTANYALRANGTVVSWNGILAPTTLSNIVQVAAGNNFGIALRAEGTLVGWGNTPYSTIPATLNNVKAIACGNQHTVVLKNDGTVMSWGTGPGTNVPAGLSGITAIAAGYQYSLALRSNGTVTAWGTGSLYTNLPASLTNVAAIYASGPSFTTSASLNIAVRSNGTVVAWGDNSFGENVAPAALSNLLAVAAAAAPQHGLVLVNDGKPQILQPPIGLTTWSGRDVTFPARAVGAAPLTYQWLLNGTNLPAATNATLALKNIQTSDAGDYQLFVSNALGTAISLPATVNVISNNALVFLSQPTNSVTNYQGSKIVTGGFAVLGNGPLRYQWFSSPTNKNYVALPGATNETLVLEPALAVQSGNYYVAISNQFAGLTSAPVNIKVQFAKSWGYSAVSNPPVNITNAIALATGGSQGGANAIYYALGADGKLTSWANYFTSYGETNVTVVNNYFITAVAASAQHVLALKSDGTVFPWGYGGYGQTNPPIGLSGVTAIACGGYHDLALKSDGTISAWGATGQSPNYGQGTNYFAATNAVAVAAGLYHSVVLRADGTVACWGNGSDGSTTVPVTATNVIAVTAGSGFSAALRANGTVVQWGNGIVNYPVPSNLSNVVAISGSATHCTALRNDGTVVTWGYIYIGLASNNIPSDLANVAAITSGGEHDFALFGTRAPAFTIQPSSRSVFKGTVRTLFAGKASGVQPMWFQWQYNGANLPGATNDVLTLTNLQFNQAGVYQVIASNSYGVTISKAAKLAVTLPLGEALDTPVDGKGLPLFNWITTGSAPWYGQTNTTHDGVDATQSGSIGNLQETILQTTIATNWAGRYTFWWKVSSEAVFDTLEFRINGNIQTSISGEVDWQQVTIPVAAGTNILQWRYSKDVSNSGGQDAAWVDQFTFIPNPPVISVQPQPASQTVNMGANVNWTVGVSGAPPLRYLWSQNGNPVGGNSSSLALNSVGRAQNGTYFVIVTNSGGSVTSSIVSLKVLVPQLLGSPSLSPDGTLILNSTDANGGLLTTNDLANFEAQGSTNLVDWTTLPNALNLTNGMLQLQDDSGTNWPSRFYRIIEH